MLIQNAEGLIVVVLIYCLLILLLIAFLTFTVYTYRQKQNAYETKILDINTKFEKSILEAQLEIQEQTFQQISQEIHDNIGQKLTLAKLKLNRLDFAQLGMNGHAVQDCVSIIGEVIADLSDLSRTMSSEVVLQNGLIKAIEYEIGQLNRAGGYKLKLQVIGEGEFLDARKELILFRIVQEGLNNIIKHADASEITIRLHYKKEELLLQVEDNGKGYLPDQKNGSGNGMANMRRRAAILQGECRIDSAPDRGTTINIQIPIHEQEQNLEGHTG